MLYPAASTVNLNPTALVAAARRVSLQRSARRRTRCPRPLKIETAEVSGHVDDFANEEQARNFAAPHRLRRKFVGVDPATSDFSFLETFGSGWCDDPRMRLLFEICQRAIRP